MKIKFQSYVPKFLTIQAPDFQTDCETGLFVAYSNRNVLKYYFVSKCDLVMVWGLTTCLK